MGCSRSAPFALAVLLASTLVVLNVEGGNVLLRGYQIGVGAALTQAPYKLLMQSDCNLVLYKNGNQALWASGTNGRGTNCYFIMQNDGNAVLYTGRHVAVFATNTNNRNDGSHYIIVQSDGNCVMYNGGGKAIWATNTNGRKLLIDGRKLLAGDGALLLPAASHNTSSAQHV